MIPVQSGVRVWIATGHTDMRRGMNSLALLVQEAFNFYQGCLDPVTAVTDVSGAKQHFAVP